MAVSPDCCRSPRSAWASSVVGRRSSAGRSLTLTLAVVTASAAAVASPRPRTARPDPVRIHRRLRLGALGGLTNVNHETVVVAVVAGVAGMLALETRASSAVGVAVSVTTIPAAAYLGVATGIGEISTVTAAFGLLAMKWSWWCWRCATLTLQSALMRRAAARRRHA